MKKISLQTAFVFFSVLFLSFGVLAQEQKAHKAKHYIDSNGKLFWNKKMPVYLKIFSDPNGEGITLKSDKQEEYVNPYYFDDEGKNQIKTKYAVDKKTGKRAMPQIEVSWDVMVDGKAPKSKLRFSDAPNFKNTDKQFFGKNLKASLNAKDAISGVEKIYYSLNQADFSEYTQEFEFYEEGDICLKFYSTDNVGNAEEVQEKHFTIDITPPETTHKIEGIILGDVISENSKINLSAEDNLSGIKTIFYAIDGGEKKIYSENISVKKLSNGKHQIVYYSKDNVNNIENEKSYTFYLDKLPPIVAADILGDRFVINDQVYFSGRTKLKLTAVDNKSGVEKIMFSVDGKDFSLYSQPFYLPSISGLHIVRYYADDKMKNRSKSSKSYKSNFEEFEHNVKRAYVDLTGPTISQQFIGAKFVRRDTTVIGPKTKIKLKAFDSESGLKYISYSLDQDKEELKYETPFTLSGDGKHFIEYFGYDNVNNRNKKDFVVILDHRPPEIEYNFSVKPVGKKSSILVFPDNVKLYLSATDRTIGTKNIYYKINNGKEQRFTKPISGFKKGTLNKIEIRSVDLFDNEQKIEIEFYLL